MPKIKITISGGVLDTVEIIEGLTKLEVELVDEDANEENDEPEGTITDTFTVSR